MFLCIMPRVARLWHKSQYLGINLKFPTVDLDNSNHEPNNYRDLTLYCSLLPNLFLCCLTFL